MKFKSLWFWYLCTYILAGLLTSGCSRDHSSPLATVMVTSSSVDSSVISYTRADTEPSVVKANQVEDVPADDLAWDVTEQRRVVIEGEGPVLFKFQMKNVSQQPVIIEKINASCGCTTVDTREMPFTLAPDASEEIQISMSLAGKFGTVTKSLLVRGSKATWTLLVTSEIKPPSDEVLVPGVPNGGGMSAGVRGRNISLAQADRQAVFKGDCASCHSRSAGKQIGYGLYIAVCAICHDAKHRASMVPDLREPDESRDADYWRLHINDGIDGTLMPAFAKSKNGILTDEQIESLVKFLVETPRGTNTMPHPLIVR